MKYWYDKEFKGVICEPDSADEWMEHIEDIAFDYDECETIESLRRLIDKIIEITAKARICLIENKIFKNVEEDNKSLIAAFAEQDKDQRYNYEQTVL